MKKKIPQIHIASYFTKLQLLFYVQITTALTRICVIYTFRIYESFVVGITPQKIAEVFPLSISHQEVSM